VGHGPIYLYILGAEAQTRKHALIWKIEYILLRPLRAHPSPSYQVFMIS